MTPQTAEWSSWISVHLAALIILALLGVFALHKLGFRFVTSASIGG